MFTTYVVYTLCILLLLWGGHFAGFKSDLQYADSTSLDSSRSVRGLAAFGVILHHISQEQTFQQANGKDLAGELSIFVNAGYLFVAVFFFWSGYGLIKNFDSKQDYLKTFIKRRIVKAIVIPYYISILIYALFHLVNGDKLAPAQWIFNLLGITMMNEYAWYPVTAAVLYLAFYFIFKNIRNQKICFTLMAFVMLILAFIFCIIGHFAWWAGPENWWLDWRNPLHQKWWTSNNVWWFTGEWWVNSAPAMLVGMLFARHEEKIRLWFQKSYWPKLCISIILLIGFSLLTGLGLEKFGYWTEYSGKGEGNLNKLITFFMQIPQSMWLCVFLFVIMLKYTVSNPVTRFFGKYSLETYMMNLIPITVFRFLIYTAETYKQKWGRKPIYKDGNYNLALYAMSVIVFSVLLAIVYKWMCTLPYKKSKNCKKN